MSIKHPIIAITGSSGAGRTPCSDVMQTSIDSAIAAEYAHVTAPLRRLGDRYAGEVCLAICAGTPVPDWVREALPALPKELQDSARRAGSYERAVLDLIEAAVLADRVGEEFDGVVTSTREDDPGQGVVELAEIGVEAALCSDRPLPLGEDVSMPTIAPHPHHDSR